MLEYFYLSGIKYVADAKIQVQRKRKSVVRYENNKCIVDNIYPDSIAEEYGIAINDELMAINGIKIINNLSQWSDYFKNEEIAFSVKRELGVIKR